MTMTGFFSFVLATSLCPAGVADARRAFVDAWQGAHVVVRHVLYSLVYDEHGKLGRTYRSRHEGLTVVTPTGMFFCFEGRDSEMDVTGTDPQQVMDRISGLYRRSEALDVGYFQRIEPSVIARYDAGVRLLVQAVRIERNRVRLLLAEDTARGRTAAAVTSLTVQWPMDLSAPFEERTGVEALIARFLTR